MSKKLQRIREREAELRRRLPSAEGWWIRYGDPREINKLQDRLAELAAQAALLLPHPIEHEEGRLVLYRDDEGSRTDVCPFCGDKHVHGEGDGHRSPHCIVDGATVVASDGTILHQKDGYILRTRTCARS